MTFGYIRNFFRVFNLKMAIPSNVTLLPDTVRGMKQLNRQKFLRNIRVSVLKLSSDKVCTIMPICKPYILKLENFKPVQSLSDENKQFDKCIYLNPEKVMCWKDIPENHRQSLNNHNVTESNLDVKEIQLTYKNFRFDDIFKAVLPPGEDSVRGFSQIGHIIHVNLREHLLEYKTFIGTVLLDKIKTCRTVVHKSHVIDNTYRNFKMEVIAGDDDFLVTVKENRCTFQFDFSKVYWNPRLCREHERIIDSLKPGDILFDVFCGVGPFAVPAAKKKCRVFANDLNPESFKWLNHNAEHNKVKMSLFKSYNLDGKEFISKTFKDFIENYCKGNEKVCSGTKILVTMNLPAMAVEFLKYFNGLIDDINLRDHFNLDIIVYIYSFAVGDNLIDVTKQNVIDNIGRDVTLEILDISLVRNVSPKKDMMKVTLKLTKEILFGINSDCELSEPPSKKICVKIKD